MGLDGLAGAAVGPGSRCGLERVERKSRGGLVRESREAEQT
jgi:hypothetical protein